MNKSVSNDHGTSWSTSEPQYTDQEIAEVVSAMDDMNREALKNNPFAEFLYRVNMAVLRSGKPVPRHLLLEAGITKQGVKKLVKDGYLQEIRLRVEKFGLVPCYTLTETVQFTADEEGNIRVDLIETKEEIAHE